VQMLADAAAKNEKTFIDHGMAPDFPAELRADITVLTTSKAAQAQAVTQRPPPLRRGQLPRRVAPRAPRPRLHRQYSPRNPRPDLTSCIRRVP
jgi:hypothetical protein